VSRGRADLYGDAETFKSLDQTASELSFVPAVEVISTGFGMGGVVRQM